jgi:hypothetical protein
MVWECVEKALKEVCVEGGREGEGEREGGREVRDVRASRRVWLFPPPLGTN